MTETRGEVLWRPPSDVLATTAMGRFATSHGLSTYEELLDWSLADLDRFWAAVADTTEVRWRRPPPSAALTSPELPGARWFEGAELNYAENALRSAAVRPNDVAVVEVSQTRAERSLSWAELADAVQRCGQGLRRMGVTPGDCVAGYMPNITETAVACLAAASIGAVWVCCSPELGTHAVIERLAQVQPRVLLAVDGYRYGRHRVDRRAVAAEIAGQLPSLGAVIPVRYLGSGPDGWTDLVSVAPPAATQFEAVPFDHPLFVLFSSGTTGPPKAIVHGHGGITLEHLKTHRFHHDLGERDRFLWFTTTTWMMWNYLLSGLLVGSTIVLFDGDPRHKDGTGLWDVADRHEVTFLGISPAFIGESRRSGVTLERGSLRAVGSTGAPLSAADARWLSDTVGVPVASISGGTDVCTAFVGPSPLLEVRAGEMSGRMLGCAVEAFDDQGRRCPSGVTGELVITAPMPSMPVALWGDDDRSRLTSTYFERFGGTWHHGDWVTFFADGACVISGRSDATLNRGGVRMGTAEFYELVEGVDGVSDSLVVHLEGSDELMLFVVLDEGTTFDGVLQDAIRDVLRRELSPRHVPDLIAPVTAVPRTHSGKKTELPVKRILQGDDPHDSVSYGALSDPSSLDEFHAFGVGHRR